MLDKWCRDVEAVDVNPAQAEHSPAEQSAVPEQVITPAGGAKKDPADTEAPEFDASCLSAWYKPGREDRALRMIELTLKDFSRIHDEIVTAAEARDGVALADGAHALKSVAAQAGALALSVLCRRLELCAREQGYSPQVMESYSHFGPAYEKAINCILAFRGSLGKSGE